MVKRSSFRIVTAIGYSTEEKAGFSLLFFCKTKQHFLRVGCDHGSDHEVDDIYRRPADSKTRAAYARERLRLLRQPEQARREVAEDFFFAVGQSSS